MSESGRGRVVLSSLGQSVPARQLYPSRTTAASLAAAAATTGSAASQHEASVRDERAEMRDEQRARVRQAVNSRPRNLTRRSLQRAALIATPSSPSAPIGAPTTVPDAAPLPSGPTAMRRRPP